MTAHQRLDNTERLFGRVFTAIGAGVCLLFSTIGLLLINSAATRALNCQRLELTHGNCELTTVYGPWKRSGQRQQFPLKQFQEAQLDETTSYDSDSGPTLLYRVVLLVNGQPIPLSDAYSSDRADKLRTIGEISQFLQNHQQSQLHLEQTDTALYIVGGMMLGIGNAVAIPFLIVGIVCLRSQAKRAA